MIFNLRCVISLIWVTLNSLRKDLYVERRNLQKPKKVRKVRKVKQVEKVEKVKQVEKVRKGNPEDLR